MGHSVKIENDDIKQRYIYMFTVAALMIHCSCVSQRDKKYNLTIYPNFC